MPITITCSACQKKLQAPDSAVGKKVRCPACQAVVVVPKPEEPTQSDAATAISEAPQASPPKTSDPKTAVSETPQADKKKAAWDDRDKNEFDFNDDEDEEDRKRRRKKRRREEEDLDDLDDLDDDRPIRRRESHRGSLILTLGIVSMLGCLCPILGWVLGASVVNMANVDLAKMNKGAMDQSGRGLTSTGKICGIIGIIIGVLSAIGNVALRIAMK
jgi:LSD1 subclass zinc finger protein